MKIVGNGLLAKQFMELSGKYPEVVIFASGVSNSKERRTAEFQREIDLLKEKTCKSDYLVYFSTISCLDTSKRSSLYIEHKLLLEKYISDTYPRFLVLRLPNVIGTGGNPSNLINYFSRRLMQGESISVENSSSRYFIDVQIIPLICMALVDMSAVGIFHVCPSQKYTIKEVVNILSDLLGIAAKIDYTEQGNTYDVSSDLSGVIDKNLEQRLNEPLKQILSRYL